MRQPLISVSIPTRNSGRTLELCLKSLRDQTYKNIEINIVDKKSTDYTVKIAHKYKVKNIVTEEGSLLKARYEGVKVSKGKYVLILDSDQILVKNALARAVKLAETKKLDMLVFEEFSYKKDTFLEKLYAYDRELINKVNDLSPFTGVIMPRFFKRSVLMKSYGSIPKKIFPHTGGPDHAIVYYEAWNISHKIDVLPNAVGHLDPATLGELLPKLYRWGYTSVDTNFGKYSELMSQKERLRTGTFGSGMVLQSFASILLIVFKYPAFKAGLYRAKIDKSLGRKRRY